MSTDYGDIHRVIDLKRLLVSAVAGTLASMGLVINENTKQISIQNVDDTNNFWIAYDEAPEPGAPGPTIPTSPVIVPGDKIDIRGTYSDFGRLQLVTGSIQGAGVQINVQQEGSIEVH